MDKTTLLIGIALGAVGMYLIIHFLWSIGYYALATVFSALGGIRSGSAGTSKSLSSMEAMVLPQVKKDFEDFDPEVLKTRLREHLQSLYGSRENFQVEALALNDYRKQSGVHQLF